MADPRFQRLMDLVGTASALPLEDREAYLRAACGDDTALLDEARVLVGRVQDTSLGALTEALRFGVSDETSRLAQTSPTLTELGPFRIIETLGEGGMGTVYLARQDAPIRRDVALKVVRAGLVSEQVLARFEAERQALASMEHPGIARVYEANTTAEGVPYFVMEYVRGEPITDYCDRHALTLDERLVLFMQVCRAIQHAHFQGIIHRDLKPSNVLVMEVDGAPVAKVIDFGIAKFVSGISSDPDPEIEAQTQLGMVIGTVEYMSPEQAQGAAVIDTRADVYSLGVLLFELVCGGLPFESETLRGLAPMRLRELLSATDPPTPSERLLKMADADTVSSHRSTDLRSHLRWLKGDHDWVVMKALERDPEHRYASAKDLAADVQRLLRDEPVEASAYTPFTRAAKFYRRHKLVVTATALVVTSIVAGSIFSTIGFVRAAQERGIAEREAAIASETSRFLTNMLAAARPQRAKGREVSVREILDIAARRLDEDSAMLPEVETNLQQTIGFSYSSLAIYDRAMTHLQQAHRLAMQTQGADSEEAARALSGMAQVHMLQGNLDEALTISMQLRDFHLARHGALSPEYSTAVANLANVYADIGDYQQAESLLRETLALDRQSQNGNNRGDLAISLNNLASVLSDQEKFAQAIVLLEESIELRRAVFGETSAEVVIAMMNLGFAQAGEEAWSDAEATLREAVAIADVVYGRMHTRTGVGLSNLSKPVAELGRVDEAIGLAEEALVVLEKTIGPDSLGVGQVKVHLGKLYTMDGQVSRGEQEMNTGWQQIAAAIGAETARTRDVAARIAMYYQDKGEPDAAAQWTARAGGSGD